MKTYLLKVEITTTTDIPLDLTDIQEAIMNKRIDSYVSVYNLDK